MDQPFRSDPALAIFLATQHGLSCIPLSLYAVYNTSSRALRLQPLWPGLGAGLATRVIAENSLPEKPKM